MSIRNHAADLKARNALYDNFAKKNGFLSDIVLQHISKGPSRHNSSAAAALAAFALADGTKTRRDLLKAAGLAGAFTALNVRGANSQEDELGAEDFPNQSKLKGGRAPLFIQYNDLTFDQLKSEKFVDAIVDPDSIADASFGTEDRREDIDGIRAGLEGVEGNVYAYLSIGEAEPWRASQYEVIGIDEGQPKVVIDGEARDIILAENENWPDNFRIKFWDKAWQDLTIRRVEGLAAKGFKGVFLDIVDAGETYAWLTTLPLEEGGMEKQYYEDGNEVDYKGEMIKFVEKISETARGLGMKVISNNGWELTQDPRFVKAIDGIMGENIQYEYGEKVMYDGDWRQATWGAMQRMAGEKGKKVYSLEYLNIWDDDGNPVTNISNDASTIDDPNLGTQAEQYAREMVQNGIEFCLAVDPELNKSNPLNLKLNNKLREEQKENKKNPGKLQHYVQPEGQEQARVASRA